MPYMRPALAGSFGAIGLAFALVACGAPDTSSPDEPLAREGSALTANDKTAFDYFLGKGLTNFQAAGIVGNLDQESGMDPNAAQPGGPGRGIAQWSVGGRWDSNANDNAVAYAAMHGKSVDSLSAQLDFIWYELTTFPGYGLAALKKSTDVTGATLAFEKDFEGCGTCLETKRVSYAEAALAAYGSDTVDAGPGEGGAKHDAGGSTGSGTGTHEGTPAPDAGPPAASAAPERSGSLGSDPGGCSVAAVGGARTAAWWLVSIAFGALVRVARRRRTLGAKG